MNLSVARRAQIHLDDPSGWKQKIRMASKSENQKKRWRQTIIR
jgi:hypothetical protein